jgi:hypothetical protein
MRWKIRCLYFVTRVQHIENKRGSRQGSFPSLSAENLYRIELKTARKNTIPPALLQFHTCGLSTLHLHPPTWAKPTLLQMYARLGKSLDSVTHDCSPGGTSVSQFLIDVERFRIILERLNVFTHIYIYLAH